MELWLLDETITTITVKKIAMEHGVDHVRLHDFHIRATNFVRNLFKRRGWSTRKLLVEKKMALDVVTGRSRILAAKGERDYGDIKPMEMPGTLDLAILPPTDNGPWDGVVPLIDWKSGTTAYDLKHSGQMKTLACALRGLPGATFDVPIKPFIVRTDEMYVEIYEGDCYTSTELSEHRRTLSQALLNVNQKSPVMRAGPWCTDCQAVEVCPTHAGPLALANLRTLTREQKSNFYERLIAAEKLVERIKERIRPELVAEIESKGPIQLSNGKYLSIVEFDKENLSKESINRALGKVLGGELIEELRRKGVVEAKKEHQLRQVNDPGGR